MISTWSRLRKKSFKFKKIEAKEQLEVVWNLLRATVYTFTKFSEIAKWARGKSAERGRQ